MNQGIIRSNCRAYRSGSLDYFATNILGTSESTLPRRSSFQTMLGKSNIAISIGRGQVATRVKASGSD